MHVLQGWANFYVIIGSSAGALTGLMFVVITLVAGQEREARTRDGVETFSSPTVMHFCAALLTAAILSAPWHSFTVPAILLALTGLYGVVYESRIMVRMAHAARRRIYISEFDDWLWYGIVPLVSYAALLISALVFGAHAIQALFALAASALLLIFVGIRNAWDVVTFITVTYAPKKDGD